jgi:hypothetical protein
MDGLGMLRRLTLVALLAAPAVGDDWPGWRGPRGDGISLEASAPLRWSATDNIAWKTALLGIGRSSPIVSRGRIFVTAGDEADQTRRLICLDQTHGRILWNQVVHRGPSGQMHRFNTTTSSTPVADGRSVFCVFADDRGLQVVAVDYQGQIIWSVSPGSFHSAHGFAASPVLYGEGVIVNGQQDGEAFVVMLDRRSGIERWRYKPANNLRSFSTPVIIHHDERDQLILTGAAQTVGLDPSSGKRLWFADGPSEKFVSTPSVGYGLVFSFGGSEEKRAMAVRLGGQGNVTGTNVVWRCDHSMPYVPTPLLLGNYLHVMSDTGIYTCLDPLTGSTLHSGRKLGAVHSSPVSVAGRIYFFEDTGKCTITSNGPDFSVLAVNELDDPVQATPAISHGQIFVRTETQLICLGADELPISQ